MAKSFSELQTLAIQIRDELNKKKNSAQRVGSALLDIIDNCIQNITDIKQKLSVFEHACSGFKRVSSEAQLPVTPSQEDLAKGFLVNTSLYLYVGTGGNAVNGRYFNVGDIRGPQGEPGSKGETGNTGPTGEKGEQGNSGVTGDTSDIVVINNLDGGESEEGSIKVLAAEQGKVLNKMFTELEKTTSKLSYTDKKDANKVIKSFYIDPTLYSDNKEDWKNLFIKYIYRNYKGKWGFNIQDGVSQFEIVISEENSDFYADNGIKIYAKMDWLSMEEGTKMDLNRINLSEICFDKNFFLQSLKDIEDNNIEFNKTITALDDKKSSLSYTEKALFNNVIKSIYVDAHLYGDISKLFIKQFYRNRNGKWGFNIQDGSSAFLAEMDYESSDFKAGDNITVYAKIDWSQIEDGETLDLNRVYFNEIAFDDNFFIQSLSDVNKINKLLNTEYKSIVPQGFKSNCFINNAGQLKSVEATWSVGYVKCEKGQRIKIERESFGYEGYPGNSYKYVIVSKFNKDADLGQEYNIPDDIIELGESWEEFNSIGKIKEIYIPKNGYLLISNFQASVLSLAYQDKYPIVINCDGDSLTQGIGGTPYPTILQKLLGDKYKVVNRGVGGETAATIAARIGAVPMYINEEITLPVDTTEVPITELKSKVNEEELVVKPIGSVNPIEICGVSCNLNIKSSNSWTISRRSKGTRELVCPSGSLIFTNQMKIHSDIAIIFIGQNGGFSNTNNMDTWSEIIRKIADFEQCNQRFINVISHGFTYNDHAKHFYEDFGAKTIMLYEYFENRSINDAIDLELITEEEAQDKTWKDLFLVDSIHCNTIGYTLIAHQIYNRIKLFGW